MGGNSINFSFGKIDKSKKELTLGNINGVSKEYLIKMAQGDEGQIKLIESIFANKNFNANGDYVLDNSEWNLIKQELIDRNKVKDGTVKVNSKEFISNLGISKKEATNEDLYRLLRSINNEDDDISNIEYNDNGNTVINYKNNKSVVYKNTDNGVVRLEESYEQDGITTNKIYDESGLNLNKTVKIDSKRNIMQTTEYQNNKQIIRHYIGNSESQENLKAVVVEENINGKNVKTHYGPLDTEFKQPTFIIENENLPIQKITDFKRFSDGSYTKTTRDISNQIIEKERYTKDERGFAEYKRYEGVNAKNYNGFPSEMITYDNSEPPKIINRVVNNIDPKTGRWISQVRYDSDGKEIKNVDFSIDGNITESTQGALGDCYLITAINSLASTKHGRQILHDNITITQDENGQNFYKLKFPGAEAARAGLLKKFPNDVNKISIKGEYTITQKEFDEATQNIVASQGDGDVLLYELSYAKYRRDVNKTIKDLNLNPNDIRFKAGLQHGDSNSTEDIEAIEGGWTTEARFILTGKKSIEYWNLLAYDREKRYGIYIDEKNHKIIPMKNVAYDSDCPTEIHQPKISAQKQIAHQKYRKANISNLIETVDSDCSQSRLNQIVSTLIADAKDGKLDEHSVNATFNVSYSRNDTYGGHAIQVIDINPREVKLIDPNDPTHEPYTMSIEDFKLCLKDFAYS